jgi:hypothetical protein
VLARNRLHRRTYHVDVTDDSPPPFIVFRAPRKPEVAERVYETSLELAGFVHQVLEQLPARFHHKNLLDRGVTYVTLELARANAAVRPGRWRYYRTALLHATDCATILDLLDRQHPDAANVNLDLARRTARKLMADLSPLTLP